MNKSYSVEHHRNSEMFRCQCGNEHVWDYLDGPMNHFAGNQDSYYYEYVCGCGRTHWKRAQAPDTNLRNEVN